MIKRVLITGASGLLGSNLALDLSPAYDVYGLVHERPLKTDRFHVLQGDLLQEGTLSRIVNEVRPDAVIHCAGLTKIDPCEKQPSLAYDLNAVVPGRLASLTSSSDIKLLHISTAAVFSGDTGNFQEGDPPQPLSVYAETKVAGEQAVLENDPRALIARISIFGWSPSGERSLAEYFFNHLNTDQQVIGFQDVKFCPLFVNDLTEIFVDMIKKNLVGTYHVVATECVSKYEFGCRIAERFGFDQDLIRPGSVEDVDFLGNRSKNLTLNNQKLQQVLDRSLPDLSTGLDQFYTRYQQGYPQFIHGMLG